ncbi:MAG: VWA domain-containing protein [Myxococcales bacterium]|nr:VWA domain-containing protein [Myxococcales bacterium]
MQRRQATNIAAILAALLGGAIGASACDGARGFGGSAGTGAGGTQTAGPGTGGQGDVCNDGEVQDCKVTLSPLNCFVGEQTCDAGQWGPCEEAEGATTKSLGPPGGCPSNPCNLGCNSYDENPPGGISLPPNTDPPPGGASSGLDPTWQQAGLKDSTHTGTPCSATSDCNFDHYCSGGDCVPWPTGNFDNMAGGPNLTVPIVCGNDILVCNRGDAQAPAGATVQVVDAIASDIGTCAPTGTVHCTTTTTGPIDPGQCTQVNGCNGALVGTRLIYVDGSPSETVCDDSWGIYDNGGTCNCSVNNSSAGLNTVDMYILLDNSGSMNFSGLWTPAKNALNGFFQDPNADGLNVALRFYGDNPVVGCTQNVCDLNACATAEVPIGSLGDAVHEAALVTAVNAQSANQGTPHQAAVNGMAQWGIARKTGNPTHTVATVYITDGQYPMSGACSTSTPTVVAPASNAYTNYDVRGYAVALNGADTAFLGTLASAGGTTMIDLQSSMNLATDLTNTLVAIQNQLAACDLAIPNAGQVDFSALSVNYYPNGMMPTTPLNQVTNAGACTGAADEYYFDDNMNPTQLTLCPAACSVVQTDLNAEVEFVGGCALGGFSSSTFTQDYEATCPGGTGGVWDYFAFDTTCPGNSYITFEVATASTQAGLATATFYPIATADAGNQVVLMSSPVDLVSIIGQGAAAAQWLQLRATLNPTSDGQSTPTVNGWDINYTCADNQ